MTIDNLPALDGLVERIRTENKAVCEAAETVTRGGVAHLLANWRQHTDLPVSQFEIDPFHAPACLQAGPGNFCEGGITEPVPINESGIPALMSRAAQRLLDARGSAEVLEAKALAEGLKEACAGVTTCVIGGTLLDLFGNR